MTSLLILRLSALGDVIHTLPAVEELRASLPDARLSWAVESPYRELVESVARVDDVIPLATRRWRRAPIAAATRSEVGILRRRLRGADASTDFQGLIKSSILGWLSGAPRRFGFDGRAIRERAALLFLNETIAVPEGLHVVDINRALARGVIAALGGRSAGSREPDLSAWPADPTGRLAGSVDPEAIALIPGAGQDAKQWNIDRFRSLATWVGEHLARPVIVVWGPGEAGLAEAIVEGGRGLLAPQTDLRELAFILSRVRLVIAGDTGPLHLAAALGTDVIGLYGPTDPRRNGPYGQQARCVESWSGDKVMESIRVEAVVERIGEILR